MWVDEAGVFQTTSLPDPALLIGESAVLLVRNSKGLKRRKLQRLVDIEEDRFMEEAQNISDIASFGSMLPYPSRPVLGKMSKISDLRTELPRVSLTWRLDAILAIDELIG